MNEIAIKEIYKYDKEGNPECRVKFTKNINELLDEAEKNAYKELANEYTTLVTMKDVVIAAYKLGAKDMANVMRACLDEGE